MPVRPHVAVSALVALLFAAPAPAATPRTFCNPIDIDYGPVLRSGQTIRHGADPVIVLFNDRYYLFSTWDKPGYRVSDDLVSWKYIPFDANVELLGYSHTYTAAAVMVLDGWMYYTELAGKNKIASLYRTRDPDSGKWEKVRTLPPYKDPCLFVDPKNQRVFMYDGLDDPIHGVELDRKTFDEIPGTKTQLLPTLDPKTRLVNGWEVCTQDNSELSKPMRGNKTFAPCREGSWMTFLNGTCYLQFATPGTTVSGYCDGFATGKSPLGPFTISPDSPISRKDSGFITSAGHSCLFQDRYGNWWRAVTMLIGVRERMERRIGIFPAGFDKDGIPYTRTELGDCPITLPTEARDQAGDDLFVGWWNLARGKKVVEVSSTLDDAHAPLFALDEDIRTSWSAKTGDVGESIAIDLGEEREIHAVQINFAEQDVGDVASFAPDRHQFMLSFLDRGSMTWKRLVDGSESTTATPHRYVQLDHPVNARMFKLFNVFTPAGGKFAVSDLRLFGVGTGSPPAPAGDLVAQRDPQDRRKVTLTWKPSDGATSYLIRYGASPEKLYQHHLINRADATTVTLYCLGSDPSYTFRVDTINDNGLTRGASTATTP